MAEIFCFLSCNHLWELWHKQSMAWILKLCLCFLYMPQQKSCWFNSKHLQVALHLWLREWRVLLGSDNEGFDCYMQPLGLYCILNNPVFSTWPPSKRLLENYTSFNALGSQHGFLETQCRKPPFPSVPWKIEPRSLLYDAIFCPPMPSLFVCFFFSFFFGGGVPIQFWGFPLNFGVSPLHFRVLPHNLGVPSPNLGVRPPQFCGYPPILGILPQFQGFPPTIFASPTILFLPFPLISRFVLPP